MTSDWRMDDPGLQRSRAMVHLGTRYLPGPLVLGAALSCLAPMTGPLITFSANRAEIGSGVIVFLAMLCALGFASIVLAWSVKVGDGVLAGRFRRYNVVTDKLVKDVLYLHTTIDTAEVAAVSIHWRRQLGKLSGGGPVVILKSGEQVLEVQNIVVNWRRKTPQRLIKRATRLADLLNVPFLGLLKPGQFAPTS